jgi:hypothetical protein
MPHSYYKFGLLSCLEHTIFVARGTLLGRPTLYLLGKKQRKEITLKKLLDFALVARGDISPPPLPNEDDFTEEMKTLARRWPNESGLLDWSFEIPLVTRRGLDFR